MPFCKKCKKELPASDFYWPPKIRKGTCKKCSNHHSHKKLYAEKDGAWLAYKRRLKSRYGISTEQYEHLLLLQNNVCAICGQNNKNGKRLAIDHDHVTGKVRGLLCNACNGFLGQFKEDTNILMKAISYIEFHKGGIH